MLNNWFQSRVAVGVVDSKDKRSQYALKWAIDHVLSKGQSVTLIHVSTTSSFFPPYRFLNLDSATAFGNSNCLK
ncbi:hypothetical protein LguiA_025755 [Lonicera macranthoides]